MNRDTLTMLGCSGSLAFMLLMGNGATASTLSPQSVGFVGTKTTGAQTVNPALSQGNPQSTSLDANSDTIGDMAIARFGCDCPSCRNKILQMVQSGRLVLPQ